MHVSEPVTLIPGYVGYVRCYQYGVPIVMLNIYASPGPRGREVLNTLCEILERDSPFHEKDKANQVVVCGGDLNRDPGRSADRKDMDTWARICELIGTIPCQSEKPTFISKDVRWPSCIDHLSATCMRQQNKAITCESYIMKQPYPGNHAVIGIRSVVINRGEPCANTKMLEAHDTIPFAKFEEDTQDTERLKRRLIAVANQAGFEFDKIMKCRKKDGEFNFKEMDDVLERVQLNTHPLVLIEIMEREMGNWTKTSSKPKNWCSIIQDTLPSQGPSDSVKSKRWAWNIACRELDITTNDDSHGVYIEVPKSTHLEVVRAVNTTERRHPEERERDPESFVRFQRYRNAKNSPTPKDGRSEVEGKIIYDAPTIIRARQQASSFMEQSPEASREQQSIFLDFYQRHWVKGGCLQADKPSAKTIYQAVLKMPDTAPGYRRIPYSAWRLCPILTTAIFQVLINMSERDSWTTAYLAPTKTVIAAWIPNKNYQFPCQREPSVGINDYRSPRIL